MFNGVIKLKRFPPELITALDHLGMPFAFTHRGKCGDGSEEQEQ